MLSYYEALDIIKSHLMQIRLETEEVGILESTGRILAEDVVSDINLPPFDNSAMDGIAVKFSPDATKWRVIGEIAAGNYNDLFVSEGDAVSIMTGSKMPPGADTIIPVEFISREGDIITLTEGFSLKKKRDVRFRGEDLQLNSVAISKNTLIRARNIPVAAACGMSKLKVYRKLKIGLLATGDELVPIEAKPVNDQIRSSNLASLAAATIEMGMLPVDYRFIKDKPELIERKLKEALNSNIDLLVTTGGVSVGKFDFMQDALKNIGAELIFWKCNIKPGKPLLFCVFRANGKAIPIISLPGNPVSSFVGFQLFVRANLMAAFGVNEELEFPAILREDLKKKDGKRHFIRGKASFSDTEHRMYVRRAGKQSSGNMAELNDANCLIVMEEDREYAGAGEWVKCIRI
jgi:molybdopterin molybdotransferase